MCLLNKQIMYNYIWNIKNKYDKTDIAKYPVKFNISGVVPILWDEHCVECAAPLCYGNCANYKKRRDGRCIRFEHGIEPVVFENNLIRGAKIDFRVWAKMEADIPSVLKCTPIKRMHRRETLLSAGLSMLEKISRFFHWHYSIYRPSQTIARVIEHCLFENRTFSECEYPDSFLYAIYNHENVERKMHIEIYDFSTKISVFHGSYILKTGWNEDLIPLEKLNIPMGERCRISMYLDNRETALLTFRYFDFVSVKCKIGTNNKPAPKVKCVAWDLDNSLWDGVIGDVGPDGVTVKECSVSLIKKLDEMGIIQTIASKNNFDIAWNKVESLGLGDYFIYPAINWGRKSQSMKAVAKELNININSFALIDDSAFERNEVRSALPQTRQYDISDISEILSYEEFDIPVTEESKKRRLSYMTEAKRKNILSSWAGDYDEFLRECELYMQIFKPTSEEEITRCAELLQRSNQYNISRERHDIQYIKSVVKDDNYCPIAYRVNDKYGNYGIVGFCCFEKVIDGWKLVDFVMSCRVAQKKIERALFRYFISNMSVGHCLSIKVDKTDRNMPLCDELKKMPFEIVTNNSQELYLVYRHEDAKFCDDFIVKVTLS